MNFPQLDPTWTTGLLTMDPGDVLSPDGRAHPLGALTPVGWSTTSPSSPTDAPSSTAGPSTPVSDASLHLPSVLNPMSLLPAHLGARLAVGVIAIIILAIAAWRLTT